MSAANHTKWLQSLGDLVAGELTRDQANGLVAPLAVETWEKNGVTNGWYCDLLCEDDSVWYGVWLDTYLRSEDVFSLGVWAMSERRAVAQAAAARAEARGELPPVVIEHRDRRGADSRATKRSTDGLRLSPGRLILDCWRNGYYLGRYLPNARAQQAAAVVGQVLATIRQLRSYFAVSMGPTHEEGAELAEEEDREERRRELVARVSRTAQARFRAELRRCFGTRCFVTGCTVADVLEAAHIEPVSECGTDHVDNGLLLRADLHLLFDTGRLRFEHRGPEMVAVFHEASAPHYALWDRRPLAVRLTEGQKARLSAR